jgi:hypothetical protein
MHDAGLDTLKTWESFYVIVGSSAGALTGLQFVVLTLITEAGILTGSGESLAAFGSPNVVHFCIALLVSAIFSAPWHDLGAPGIAVALSGIGGFVYAVAVLRRAQRQRDYRPVLEDWIWHAVLPLLAYAALIVAGIELLGRSGGGLYFVGGATLLLMFIGIHNAWDTVTYVTLQRARDGEGRQTTDRAKEPPPSAPAPPKQASPPPDSPRPPEAPAI